MKLTPGLSVDKIVVIDRSRPRVVQKVYGTGTVYLYIKPGCQMVPCKNYTLLERSKQIIVSILAITSQLTVYKSLFWLQLEIIFLSLKEQIIKAQ